MNAWLGMASDSEDELLAATAVALLAFEEPKERSCWVRPWIQRRGELGAYNQLMAELRNEDPSNFRNFLRMTPENFEALLDRVSPLITKADTHMRTSIAPGEKLAITLRYLATGDSFKSLEFLYRVPKNTISKFLPEVCTAIYTTLKDDFMKVPQTSEEWEIIAQDFHEKWNFPNCIGALDGKHIAIRAPHNSGSQYYNYKHFFSIILLALVDANYRFIYVDVGANGRSSDAGVFANSSLLHGIEDNTLHIPDPTPLPGRQDPMPFVIVGDDAFPLKTNIMKPYPHRHTDDQKKAFNYRLSRARRVSENAFGILSTRFAIFQRNINVCADTSVKIVLACVALHNFLCSRSDKGYTECTESVSMSSSVSSSLTQQCGNRSTDTARDIRDEFADYFCSNGQVEFQWDHIV